jgi:hypothetical protein
MARRSGRVTRVDEPFGDGGLDFARRRFFDAGICLLPVESFDLGRSLRQVAHTIGHDDRTHEHRPRRKFTPLDLSLIVDHGSRFESTKPTAAGMVRAPKEA